MKKTKTTRDYLPKKDSVTLIQVRVPESLAESVKVILDKEGISWVTFFKACMNRFLDEEDGA